MAAHRGYLLCSTPRTGSTYLCSLLSSTDVLGHPESYFREPDEVAWATRFGLSTAGGRVREYDAFVDSVRTAGTSTNGVFAVRIMWGSLPRLLAGLGTAPGETDVAVLQRAFGQLTFVHLTRRDVAAQAVSWTRAEQTGYWHDGDEPSRWTDPDLHQMLDLVETIRSHNAAWRAWFTSNGVEPLECSYEDVVADPQNALAEIAARLQVGLPAGWQPQSPQMKQADEMNERWATLLRSAMASETE